MATKLYVGNLPFSLMEADLQELFSQAGQVVTCELVLDRMTSKPRGFAFVEMASQEEADKAVEQFNGYEVDGRPLVVNEARPREPRSGGGGFGGHGGGGGYGGGGYGGGGGGRGGKRKSGKGSRRGARQAKRDRKGAW
jgi:RNA recognition motif-containing protein